MIAKNVTPYQTFATITATIAYLASASHGTGVSISCVFISRSLTTPNSPLNIQRNRMPIRNPDTAHGKNTSAWYVPRNRNFRRNHSAIVKPIRNCGTSDPTTQTTEFVTVPRNISSFSSVLKFFSPTHEVSDRSFRL